MGRCLAKPDGGREQVNSSPFMGRCLAKPDGGADRDQLGVRSLHEVRMSRSTPPHLWGGVWRSQTEAVSRSTPPHLWGGDWRSQTEGRTVTSWECDRHMRS